MLASFDIDGVVGDPELARLARFAARLCNAPSAAVSLVEAERQRFIAGEGLEVNETARTTSICAHTMMGDAILEVLDASQDPRFGNFELVRGDAHVRYYAGAPLISSEGSPMGALCVTDSKPHDEPLDEFQMEGLLVLAEAVKRRLEAHRQAYLAMFEMKESAERLQFMLDSVPDIAWSAAPGPVFDNFNARWGEVTGLAAPKTVEDWRQAIHPDDFDASAVKFKHAIETATEFEDEWRLRLADGSYRYVVSRAVPSCDDPAKARWFGTLTDIDDRYRISQERELLAGELAHRIKNIFSVISGLVSLRSRGSPENQAFGEALNDNIRALSRAQAYALPGGGEGGEQLIDLLGVLMKPYGADGSNKVSIAGESAAFGKRAATPLALIFHELATNSAKYGALSAPDGTVAIAVSSEGDEVIIDWRESGGPDVAEPQSTGFGSRLISMAIDHQLGGKIMRDWRESGLSVTISIPRERLSQ